MSPPSPSRSLRAVLRVTQYTMAASEQGVRVTVRSLSDNGLVTANPERFPEFLSVVDIHGVCRILHSVFGRTDFRIQLRLSERPGVNAIPASDFPFTRCRDYLSLLPAPKTPYNLSGLRCRNSEQTVMPATSRDQYPCAVFRHRIPPLLSYRLVRR